VGTTPILHLPFVDPTDLVRDFPGDDEAQMLAVEAAIEGIPVVAGIGSNAVQVVKTDVFSSTSNDFEDITGLTVTITPSSDTAKVLVLARVTTSSQPGTNGSGTRLLRGSTVIYAGDAEGTRPPGLSFAGGVDIKDNVAVFVDSPETTDAVTYKVQLRRAGSGTVYVNRSSADGDGATGIGRFASSIVAIEVAP